MLTNEQVSFFKQDGYLAIKEFWDSRETAAMQAEVSRFQREGLLRNVTTEGDGKTHSEYQQNLQLCPMSNKSGLFRALPYDRRVTQAVSQLIGDPVILHLDQVFLKPAHHGAGTSWHQDNAYFGLENPAAGTAMWIAVHDANIANGTLEVIPDFFEKLLDHSRDPNSDHHIRCYPPEELAVPVELPAGGVIFFSYGTPHCTRANLTERDRAGAAFHFYNGKYNPSSGFLLEKRVYLTGENKEDGQRAYGEIVADTWRDEVEKALSTAAVI